MPTNENFKSFNEEPPKPTAYILPAIIDFLGASLQFLGLSLISATSYQMLKTFELPMVALLSIAFMRHRYDAIHVLSMVIVLAGLTVVSLQSIEEGGNEGNSAQLVELGLLAMTLGQLCHASQVIIEESLLKHKGGQDPIHLLAWEGIWGILINLVALAIAQQVKCPLDASQCVNEHIDDLGMFLKQLEQFPQLIWLAIMFTAFCGLYNWAACVVIKHQTAVNRNISDQIRVVVVWIFFALYAGLGHEEFSTEKLIGFILIVIGVLGFNKVFRYMQTADPEKPIQNGERPSFVCGTPMTDIDEEKAALMFNKEE